MMFHDMESSGDLLSHDVGADHEQKEHSQEDLLPSLELAGCDRVETTHVDRLKVDGE